jgi:gliding motility-associated-like protein
MKKLLLSLTFTLATLFSWSQCGVTAVSSLDPIPCGTCVDLNAMGISGIPIMNNDFSGGVVGAGWSSTTAATFTNPCGPGPGGTYMWMGAASPAPRELTTNGFDMSCGGQVCFDFRMAEQGGASPCEGPDTPLEGINFQYSIDGGVTWNVINYFNPGGGFDPIMTTWNNYCYTLPPAAWTTNTMFQWEQNTTSSALFDHWGVDNIVINANDCGYYYDWSHASAPLATVGDSTYGGNICPTTTTTYNVMYTNGINDTCNASVTVNVLFPLVSVSATPNDTITTCGGCVTLNGTMGSIPPDSCCYTLDMQDTFGDGWNGGNIMVNPTVGPALGPFTAIGRGSIITFCVPDGTTFTLDYTAGTFESENTYTLYDPTMVAIFNDGPTPTTGNVFTTTASCGTAPPVYTWTWTGPGLTTINDSTQTACPTVSSWYYVTLSAGGCQDMDSIYIEYIGAPDSTTVDTDVCANTIYTFPDLTTQTILTPTTQVSNLTTVTGCDSIITTNITLVTAFNVTVNDVVCDGDPYTFPDGSVNGGVTTPITQVSTLTAISGCDSIITTNLTVDPVYNITQNVDVCSGDPYTFPDGSVNGSITTPMAQVSNLTTVNGCDSIITTNVGVNPIYNTTQNVNVCDGDQYTFPDATIVTITTPVIQVSNLTTVNGCDSIITTNVGVNPIYNTTQNINVCDGDDYTFPDGFTQMGITTPMTHVSNLTTVNGCDSIITTSVGVFPTYTTVVNGNVCDGNNYTFADGSVQNITTPVSYTSTLTSINGCDSLVTENIGVFPTYNLVENFTQCPDLGFTFPDGTTMTSIMSNTTHISNLITSNGCDSIITTNVNIHNVPPMDITVGDDGCPNLILSMTNNTVGTGCDWVVTGPGTVRNYTGCGTITDTYYNSGLYDINLIMSSVDGCPMDTIITDAFEVYPKPVAQFNWNPTEGTIIDNTINFDNLSIGSTTNTWSFGDGDTSNMFHDSHMYQDTGHYDVGLTVTNDYGCSDTTSGTIIINDVFFLYVPNTFTPNNDMFNNIFKPIVSGYDQNRFTLYIYDRWGELLFETHNSEVGWDGTYQGSIVQNGVYVWKIDVRTHNNLRKEYVGHVTLLR